MRNYQLTVTYRGVYANREKDSEIVHIVTGQGGKETGSGTDFKTRDIGFHNLTRDGANDAAQELRKRGYGVRMYEETTKRGFPTLQARRNPPGHTHAGYPDKRGVIRDGHGVDTGWTVSEIGKRFTLPDVLSHMAKYAYAIVVRRGTLNRSKRTGVGLSYGEGMLARFDEEDVTGMSDSDILRAANSTAETMLQTDIEDAEREESGFDEEEE